LTRRRCELSATEIAELHERLERLLDKLGLETQPKVAVRLLELVQNPDALLKDYTDIIKTDWTLTGRLLKLANSAFYAQRSPVTKLDRALILLGLERTKAISLGFYLARAAAPPDVKELARIVWGESVYRGGLCAVMARAVCPAVAAEAFIVGLMLDCGQPLMAKLIGPGYTALRQEAATPAKLHTIEFDRLEYTHADVAAVMMKRWKLPTLLARPIAWHHTLPIAGKTSDPGAILQRLAYYAGAIRLNSNARGTEAPEAAPLSSIAGRLFELDEPAVAAVVQRAGSEYQATIELFSEQATRCQDVDQIAEVVQQQLAELMDQQMTRSVRLEAGAVAPVTIGGQTVELEPGRSGEVVAYLSSDSGERIISSTINPQTEPPEKLCGRLGIEQPAPDELEELGRAVRAMAA